MDHPSAVDLLREVVGDLPDEAEDHALAALAALSEPSVADAALVENAILARLEEAAPHLVTGRYRIEATAPVTLGPRATRPEGDPRPEGTVITGKAIVPTSPEYEYPSCPDCRRGLRAAAAGVLTCVTLPARVGNLNGQPGDVVACGKER